MGSFFGINIGSPAKSKVATPVKPKPQVEDDQGDAAPLPKQAEPPSIYINTESNHMYECLGFDKDMRARLRRVKTYSKQEHKYLEENIPNEILVNRNTFSQKYAKYEARMGILVTPNNFDTFQRMVLTPQTYDSIQMGITVLDKRQELVNTWGMDEIESENKCALNFYGPPGTGKTMAARALAKQLNKTIIQVNYASIISKYTGDTAKGICTLFEDAKKLNAILYFDEADSLLSKRTANVDESWGTSINQNRNVLMQELDRYDGIVIFSTNFFQNYDEAILRRIAQHIKFDLPTEEMRAVIFDRLTPKKIKDNKLMSDAVIPAAVGAATESFSGGDIKNVIVNSIKNAVMHSSKITPDILVAEIERIRNAKIEHATAKKKSKVSQE